MWVFWVSVLRASLWWLFSLGSLSTLLALLLAILVLFVFAVLWVLMWPFILSGVLCCDNNIFCYNGSPPITITYIHKLAYNHQQP
jgi:hypothetical protein